MPNSRILVQQSRDSSRGRRSTSAALSTLRAGPRRRRPAAIGVGTILVATAAGLAASPAAEALGLW